MKILAIESSCDDTAAAVTEGRTVLSSAVASQIPEHRLYGGVVPEIASRRHAESICAVCEEALNIAALSFSDIDAVAVTFAPGLIGALLVGVNYAKGLSMSLGVPLIPVHHLRSHIAANYINAPELTPPFLCLMVSGGNTYIIQVNGYTDFKILGRTADDAAGECFDKSARAMGLPYPGGIELDKIASLPDFKKYPLPHPTVEGRPLDFSFSGLKTAVVNLTHTAAQKGENIDVPMLAACVRQRVCDMLIDNTFTAAHQTYPDGKNAKIVLAGGVSANSELRSRMEKECKSRGFELYLPQLKYCGDNAAMVGVAAYYEYLSGNVADPALNAAATLPIDYRT